MKCSQTTGEDAHVNNDINYSDDFSHDEDSDQENDRAVSEHPLPLKIQIHYIALAKKNASTYYGDIEYFSICIRAPRSV